MVAVYGMGKLTHAQNYPEIFLPGKFPHFPPLNTLFLFPTVIYSFLSVFVLVCQGQRRWQILNNGEGHSGPVQGVALRVLEIKTRLPGAVPHQNGLFFVVEYSRDLGWPRRP